MSFQQLGIVQTFLVNTVKRALALTDCGLVTLKLDDDDDDA